MPRAEPLPAEDRAARPAAPAFVVARALEMIERTAHGRDPRIAQLVEVDAVLRGAVLRLVRCPVYAGSGADPRGGSVADRLGADTLADAFRAVAPETGTADPGIALRRARRWLHGVAVAAAARWISNQGECEDPDGAYLAGLAHACCRHPGYDDDDAITVAPEILSELRFGPVIDAVLRATAGGPRSGGGAAQEQDEAVAQLVAVVTRADELAQALGHGWGAGRAAPAHAEPDAAAVSEAIDLEHAHVAALLGLPRLPAAELARELAAREVAAAAQLAPRAGDFRVGGPILRLAASHVALVELRSGASIHEIFERGLGLVRGGLTFDRVVAIERELGRNDVARVRAVSCRTGLGSAAGRALVEVPLANGGALTRILDGGPPQRTDRADEAYALRILGVRSAAAAPLRAGSGAVVGVLLGDHFVSQLDVSDDEIASLGLAAGTFGLVLENSALHAEGKTLRALAEKDELTGISNRRNILDVLRREIDRARRYGKPLSIAMIDVDHFKAWNDVHGHQAGDTVLQTVAQLISSCSREIDACGRYGGEEFLVVLPETPPEHAVLYAERLRDTVERHGAEFAAAFPGARLTVSAGVAHLLVRGDDADHLIQRADWALYAAKANGRNRVCADAAPRPSKVTATLRVRGILDEA